MLSLLLALAIPFAPQATPDYVWLEGEKPTAHSFAFDTANWGRKEILSNQAWLRIGVEGGDLAKVPAEGVKLDYAFETRSAGNHEIWNRIGYEFVRSDFEWSIDGGNWTRVKPTELTTDLMPIAEWTEVAWIRLGTQNLSAGKHTLSIRLPVTKNGKGEPQRILYASDAIVVSSGEFRPSSFLKPDALTPPTKPTAFAVPDATADGARQSMELGGTWEVTRNDEQTPPFDVAVPMTDMPKAPRWSEIPVPSDRNVSRPDLTFAHRLWYRTRVTVPENQKARSFRLEFGQNNLNTTVMVNGQLCGFEKNPFVKFGIDISSAIKPGENEILVGIRDAWYGFSSSPNDPMKLRRMFNLPVTFTNRGFLDLAYPVWNSFQSGILDTPVLVASGAITASDVFVQPNVAKKALTADVEVRNNSGQAATAKVQISAISPTTQAVEAEIASQDVSLAAGQTKTVALTGPFANARLWWPDDPQMTHLRTTISIGGKVVDVSNTPFGFREWGSEGLNFTLNGQIWRGWAELTQGQNREDWLANYRRTGQRFQRMSGVSQNGGIRWNGMTFNDALKWTDENGVVIRRSGILDGQAIGYMAIENDDALKKLYKSEIKQQLMNNWRDQMVAQVKGERNHPSIHLWSLENEWLYINCINLYGGLMDEFEREVLKVGEAVKAADPSRLWMTDGGSAGKANLFPVHGDHYVYTNEPSRYPDLAYADFPEGGGRGRWLFDGKRPRYAAEDYFASGINPADYAWIAGPEAFEGKTAAHRGMALVQRMLTEGYRWNGKMAAAHFWLGEEGAKFGKHNANTERAVFVREYDTTFAGGKPVTRTLGLFNDSRFTDPITAHWELKVGATVVKGERTEKLAPGTSIKFPVNLAVPAVTVPTVGSLRVSATVGGKEVFREARTIRVIPAPKLVTIPALGVWDPNGKVAPFLKAAGVSFTALNGLENIPATVKTLLVGPNALSEADSTQPTIAAFALRGGRAIVLEQKHALRYQALPTALEPKENQGEFAFPEDLQHPVLAGLAASDFWAWSGDGTSYRNAYVKPVKGAKSLVQCQERLTQSALLEVPVGEGVVLLSQLLVGEKLGSSVVAQTVLKNLLGYAGTYKLVTRPVTTITEGNAGLKRTLDGIGVAYTESKDLVAALAKPGIVVADASAAHLKTLTANLAKVKAFTAAGGSLVLNGLTPEGLADYNQLVGVNHMIRPFRREKTTLALPPSPLTSGLSLGEVVMMSGERMFDFNQDMFVADDIFRYVVDLEDAAPFAKLPDDYFYNTTNGFVSSDGWKYIFSFDLRTTPDPQYTMEFPQEVPLTEMEWVGNGFYHFVNKLEFTFDAKPTLKFDVKLNTEPQTLTLPDGTSGKLLRLRIADWVRTPGVTDVVGIDNIRLKIKRPASYFATVRPMMNIGGLVEYKQGAGNIVLANLWFKDSEAVPENAVKKKAIFAAILRNLKAPFAASKTVVAGAVGNVYVPIDIAPKANQFRNEKGWFGDTNFSFRDFPTGEQTLAGVKFKVYEFTTSPVPNAIMLGAGGIPGNLPDQVEGIAVNQKAATLFFLTAARIDRPMDDRQRNEGRRPELAQIVIRYADGKEETVPLRYGEDIESYRQSTPRVLPGAQIAWTKAVGGETAVAYVKQWNNPRPDAEIRSITLRYGNGERVGVPAILAISAVK